MVKCSKCGNSFSQEGLKAHKTLAHGKNLGKKVAAEKIVDLVPELEESDTDNKGQFNKKGTNKLLKYIKQVDSDKSEKSEVDNQ